VYKIGNFPKSPHSVPCYRQVTKIHFRATTDFIFKQDLEEAVEKDKLNELKHTLLRYDTLENKLNYLTEQLAVVEKQIEESQERHTKDQEAILSLQTHNQGLKRQITFLETQVQSLKEECATVNAALAHYSKQQLTATKLLGLDGQAEQAREMERVCQELMHVRRKLVIASNERDLAHRTVGELLDENHNARMELRQLRGTIEQPLSKKMKTGEMMPADHLVAAQLLLDAALDFDPVFRRMLTTGSNDQASANHLTKFQNCLKKLVELCVDTDQKDKSTWSKNELNYTSMNVIADKEASRLERTFVDEHWPRLDLHKFFSVPGEWISQMNGQEICTHYVPQLCSQFYKIRLELQRCTASGAAGEA